MAQISDIKMLAKEPTSKRRAQRVKVPAFLEVENKIYQTEDLSVLGAKIGTFHREVSVDDELEGRLILPFREASLSFSVKLVCRHRGPKGLGLEFKDLSPQKRRALRQYIEFAIEGRLGDLETVVSTLNLPAIESPIQESLAFAEEEQARLYRSFKRHMWFWIFFGGLVLTVFILFVVYNTVFIFKTLGIVTGDKYEVKAGHTGRLKGVYVKPGDYVPQGKVLFELSNEKILAELEGLQKQMAVLEKALKTLTAGSPHLKALKEFYLKQEEEYLNAQNLYQRGIISLKDFRFVENNYLKTKLRLFETLSQKDPLGLRLKLGELRHRYQTLRQQMEAFRVKAPLPGWVETVHFAPVSRVYTQNTVVTLRTGRPFVLARVPNWELTKMALDEPVKIYAPLTGRTYLGKITAIGLAGFQPQLSPLKEITLKETVIKIEFINEAVVLPYNSRVKVWLPNKIYARLKHALAKIRP